MVNGIGQGSGGIARAAVESAMKAALERKADSLRRMDGLASKLAGAPSSPREDSSFGEIVANGLAEIDGKVKAAGNLPQTVLTGNLDFHEVAAQLKQSGMAFDFALAVRNKFIDAYREVMRMSV